MVERRGGRYLARTS